MVGKRNRRTRAEMLEAAIAKVAKLEAQIEGSYKDEDENDVLKALKRKLRKTSTALRAARVTLNGLSNSEGKIARKPISETILRTRDRLESQIETQERAEVMVAKLPFDVERLESLIAQTEIGDIVEFPTDLTLLGDEQERTDEEHETAFIAKEEMAEE